MSKSFANPAIPDAAPRCPMFALTEPTCNGWDVGVVLPWWMKGECSVDLNTRPTLSISHLSPTWVPVPCASMTLTSLGFVPLRVHNLSNNDRRLSTSGRVIEMLPWFLSSPTPRITPRIRSFSSTADERSFKTKSPHPSDPA